MVFARPRGAFAEQAMVANRIPNPEDEVRFLSAARGVVAMPWISLLQTIDALLWLPCAVLFIGLVGRVVEFVRKEET